MSTSDIKLEAGDPKHARLTARAERERLARKEAERLLDEKSRELYQANQALEAVHSAEKKAAAQLRAILENLPIAVLIARPDGTVRWINEPARGLFGTTPNLARDREVSAFLPHLADAERAEAIMSAPPSDPSATVGRRSDGSEFPAEVSLTATEDPSEPSVIWMVRDVTHRTLQEQRRLKLEDDLRRAQRLESLGTMAGGIAHELNTPIQFIIDNTNFLGDAFKDMAGAIDALKTEVSPDKCDEILGQFDLAYLTEEIPNAIEQSREGLKRVAEIVLAIKRFSHPATAAKEDNDLNQIIQTTVLVSKNQWKYVSELDLELATDLPRVKSNAGELNQVLLNLIVNAAHAIEDKGTASGMGKIRIATRAVPGAVECSVSDSGVGIKPELRDKIFDLFFTTKAPGRGTGQGLALVHSIVTQSHGGRIAVDSELGKGTTLTFALPTGGDAPANPAEGG
ncbi:MAG: PAS domain S-box protein [Alphaproteobacteria bacterium]|nr:PAS domain S-box protein [Alphaproteobacteria bacterium]